MLTLKKDFKFSNHIGIRLLLILFSLLSACSQLSENVSGSSGALSPEPTVDPWITAVDDASQLLGVNAEFEDHIHSYLDIAAEVNGYLVVIEQARPALDLLDSLKSTEIPLVGNAWDIIINALDTAFAGSGQALVIADSGLRQIMAFKGKLDSLQAMIPVASASELFRVTSTAENLRALDRNIESGKGTLLAINQDLQEQIQNLNDYLDSFELVQQGLSLAGTLSGVPIVGEAINSLNHSLNEIISPVQDFHDSAQELHNRIQSDLGVMESIQEIVYQAENPVPQPGDQLSQESIISFLSDWAPILLIGLVAVIFFGGFLLWRSQAAKVRPATAQISQAYSPPISQSIEKLDVSFPPPAAIAPKIRQARLEFISGQIAGQSISLTRDNLLVGRGSACDVIIPDPAVSRQHARLRYAEDVWFIQDQDSTSGLIINGQMTPASRLKSGDRIQIGDTNLVFREG